MSESVLSDYGSEEAAAHTIAILTQLKAENVDLKRNFENLKALHIQLNETYKNLQGRYTSLYEERTNVEKQYQSLCESWRVELEEKQRHLEAAKAQILGPRDMDVLRVKLLAELEAPYQAKVDNLTKEAESSHQAYLKLRREYEELQNTYRSLEVRTVGDQEAARQEHTALSRELRDKTAQLLATQAKLTSSEGAVRALQRDLEAAKYSTAQMRQELEEVRRAKERAVVDREAAAMQADKKVKAAEEETAQLMSFVESVSRKNRHLVQELADSQRAGEDLFAANVRLQSAQAQLQSQLDSTVRLAAGEKAALLAEHEEAVRGLEERLEAAAASAAKRDGAITELKLAQQDELSKLVASWEARLAEEKRQAAERVRELLDQRADAAERAAAATRAAEERRREDEAALRAVQAQAEAASREAASEALRAETLSKQLAEATAAAEAARAELAETKPELVRSQMLVQQLTERRAELEQRIKVAEEATVQVRAARDAMAAEVESVRREADEERAAAARVTDSSRSAWALEKAALAKRYQAAVKELTTRHEADLRKAKRKARGAHAAVAQLTDEVADLKFKAVEARHVNHMSEVLYLNSGNTGRSGSPYYPYSPGSLPGTAGGGGGGLYGSGAYTLGGGGGRPGTAPSYVPGLASVPAPNVVIVTGNGNGGGAGGAGGASRNREGDQQLAPEPDTHQAPSQQSQQQQRRQQSAQPGAHTSQSVLYRQQSINGSVDGTLHEQGVGGSTGEFRASMGATGGTGGGGGAAMVDSALLSTIATLRHQQQQYRDAARYGGQP